MVVSNQIQGRFWLTAGYPASMCGIIVREGDNVLGVDRCDPNYQTPRLVKYSSSELHPGAGVYSNKNRNMFYVSVEIVEHFLTFFNL